MGPMNCWQTSMICFLGTGLCRRMRHMYSFPAKSRVSMILVASPSRTGKMPVTLGSNVPLCPAFSTSSMRLTQAATSWLVGPEVLSRLMAPKERCCLRLRFSGGRPNEASVLPFRLTRTDLLRSDGRI